jgi:starch synthase
MLYAGIDWSKFTPYSPYEYFGLVNAMKVGIMFADKVTTVSPNYSQEIRLQYYGEGLDGVLNERSGDFLGILNGIDSTEWNPDTDKLIYKNYDSTYLEGKRDNKHILLRDFGLNEGDDLDLPMVSVITRLAEQKGIDLISHKMEELLSNNNFRFFVLASGDYSYEKYLEYLHHRFPRRVQIFIGYDNNLAHKIYAASDFFLMPSRFEPCGLAQMFSLKYGTIPIVRETGGLSDTVQEYNYYNMQGTGFTFWQYDSEDMAFAIQRALGIYKNEPHWDTIRRNAMSQNFSAAKTAAEYIQAFQWAKEKI